MFQRRMMLFLSAAIAVSSFSACSNSQNDEKSISDPADQRIAQKLELEDQLDLAADEYARIGEILLLAEGFQYAKGMFDKAIELSPNHSKALFYRAMLAPIFTLEGLIPRIKNDHTKRDIDKYIQAVEKSNVPELTRFLLNKSKKKQRIQTAYQHQNFLRDELLPALISMDEDLSNIKDDEFSLLINFNRLGAYAGVYKKNYCTRVKASTPYWICGESGSVEVNSYQKMYIDDASIAVIRSTFMGMQDYIRLVTAYSLVGLEKYRERLNTKLMRKWDRAHRTGNYVPNYWKTTEKEAVQEMDHFPGFLDLHPNEKLTQMPRSLGETVSMISSLRSYQDTLCEESRRSDEKYYPIRALCITTDFLTDIDRLDDFLTGSEGFKIGNTSAGESVYINLDVSRFTSNPPRSLRDLMPKHFDGYGSPIDLKDPSFGGLFPDGDFVAKLRMIGRFEDTISKKGATKLMNDLHPLEITDIIRNMNGYMRKSFIPKED